MKLLVPAAAAAALLAATMAQDATGESPDYRWVRGEDLPCSALLNGPGPDGIGPINGSVETGMRDALFYVFRVVSDDWPIAEQPHAFPIEVGFDGAVSRTRVEEAWAWQRGALQFELDDAVRSRLATAQSMEIYRDGRRIGAVPARGLGAALEAIGTCAANDQIHADAPMDMNAAVDSMDTTDMNATADPGPMEAAAERALEAAANAVEAAADAVESEGPKR